MLPRVSIYAAALVLAAAAAPPAAADRPGLSTPAAPPFDLGFSSLLRVARGPIRVLATAVAKAPSPAPPRRATRASRARRSSACTLNQIYTGVVTAHPDLVLGVSSDHCLNGSTAGEVSPKAADPSADWLCSTSNDLPPSLTKADQCAFYEIRLFKAFGDLGCDLNAGSLINEFAALFPGNPIPASFCIPKKLPSRSGLDSCPLDYTTAREACNANAVRQLPNFRNCCGRPLTWFAALYHATF